MRPPTSGRGRLAAVRPHLITKRKARRLYAAAQRAYTHGLQWSYGVHPAPSGYDPCRIAFNAGVKAAEANTYTEMPLDVWVLVYADWLRRL